VPSHSSHRGDDHVHRRTGEGHDQLLGRFFRQALHAGDAPKGPQGHVAGLDAVAARGEDVTKLMQQDAQKH
jgi:hypothetical protein